ncbi:MAG: ATP-binding protein [Paludibacteraceae bacterium]|nr:ATP-binding protein [Paludibacteraceae bacterium]
MAIVGRNKEINELNELYNSEKSEFVVVYGRRRVGKTFLIDESMDGKITFRHAGLSPIEIENLQTDERQKKSILKQQLKHFYISLQRFGMKKSHQPTSWLEAFFMLSQLLESLDNGERQVVFLDELPWLDTPKSGFVMAFEGFWNTWACHRRNLMLIACGSATSWIQDNFINNHGGLYGRTTREIHLAPFTLGECEEFYKSRGVKWSRYYIVQSYMVMGGIPYYMNYVDKGMSIDQAVNALFFDDRARLQGEYDRLFASVFGNPDEMKSIIEVMGKKHSGWTRKEIVDMTGLSDNGTLSKMLKALVASDFAVSYVPFGMKNREEHFKLTDHFCWFWLHFVKNRKRLTEYFWQGDASQAIVSWRGIAFEEVCWSHWRQIKRALGIDGVVTELSAWTKLGDDDSCGTQIDMLIKRNDHIVNMCEMKFYNAEFSVDKDYYKTLVHRGNLLQKTLPKRVVVHPTLVTTEGLEYNEYSGIFQKVVTLDDLFQ